MKKIIEFLQGKKTYLVCAAALITALVAYLDGTMTVKEFVTAAFAALGGITLRAGVGKAE